MRFLCKRTASVIGACMIALCAFGLIKAGNLSKFATVEGVHTYYLDSASSQGLQTRTLTGLDIFRVKGESVRIAGKVDENFVFAVLREYGAQVKSREDVYGVTSYYCYTAKWSDSVYVSGERVNLHIAVGADGCVIGSPIIFGGY